MQKSSGETKLKLDAKILILLLVVLFFVPILSNAQEVDIVDISVSARVKPATTTPPTPAPPPPPWIYIPPETEVILKGRAYPLANLTILKNGTVISTFKAENSGLFERKIKGIAGGTYNFSIFAEDTKGRISATLSFSITILESQITTVSGIFISPTIEINPMQVVKGEEIEIFGQSFPESEINIFISPKEIVAKTKTSSQGDWLYKLDTTQLEEMEYETKAKAIYGDGEQSPFSQVVSFSILKPRCRGADLNFDGEVDLVDFSILLYFWNQKKPVNICADINSDGIVNIIDFSIMMYWWTG